jgi:4-amino-4-deoxy-L-arabinose transferase-like glycosyltransferase
LLLVGGVLLIALLARGALLTRAPLFIRRDSIAYYQVGYEFANGLGFDLPLRRTPLYPLFIAGGVATFGEDLRGLALAQHLLGLVTVAATYFLGRAMFGRVAGALAALAMALSAPLLIYEHYILAEPLFIPVLTVGLLLVVLAIQRERAWLYVAGGLVLALAALSRPVGQALLPVAPLAILAHHRRLRPAIVPAMLVLFGFAVVLVPWMLRSSFTTGRVDGAGALGQSLVGRIIRHDEGFVLPNPDSPSPANSRQNPEVRNLILTQMNRDARPSAINHRVREVYGLSETEADTAMRDVAIEIFTSQPGRYAEGTIAKLRRLFVGEDERLRTHWATRKDGEMRDDWLDEASIAHLYSPPSAVQEQEFPTAEAVTRIFQPYLWRYLLIPLVLIGIVGGLWLGPRGPTALLVLATLALVVPSAALVGYVPRYRYPTDPLLAVLAAGGLVIAFDVSRRAWNRRRARRRVTST